MSKSLLSQVLLLFFFFFYFKLLGHSLSSLSTSIEVFGVGATAFFFFPPPPTTIYWGCLFIIINTKLKDFFWFLLGLFKDFFICWPIEHYLLTSGHDQETRPARYRVESQKKLFSAIVEGKVKCAHQENKGKLSLNFFVHQSIWYVFVNEKKNSYSNAWKIRLIRAIEIQTNVSIKRMDYINGCSRLWLDVWMFFGCRTFCPWFSFSILLLQHNEKAKLLNVTDIDLQEKK